MRGGEGRRGTRGSSLARRTRGKGEVAGKAAEGGREGGVEIFACSSRLTETLGKFILRQ